MGFLEYLEKMRERSLREREQWALSIALGFTAFLSVLWLSFSLIDFSPQNVVEYVPQENREAKLPDSPFGEIKKALREIKAVAGEAWGAIGRSEYVATSTQVEIINP